MKIRIFFFGIALAMVAASRPAMPEQDASRLFRQGVGHFEAGRYEQALEAFEAVYAERQLAGVLYNIAMCYRALDRVPEAVNAFRRYLRDEDPSRVSRNDLLEIRGLLREMRDGYGDLDIHVDVEGAAIELDGHPIGTSPLGIPFAVAPGEHRVSASLEGYTGDETTVTVEAGLTRNLALNLEPIPPPAPAPEPEPETEPVPAPVSEPEPETVPEPEPTPGRRLGWWFWTPMALCMATTVGTAITGGLTLSYRSDYLEGDNTDAGLRETGTGLAVATDALLGVALGTGALAVIALIVHYARQRRGGEERLSSSSFTPSLGLVGR